MTVATLKQVNFFSQNLLLNQVILNFFHPRTPHFSIFSCFKDISSFMKFVWVWIRRSLASLLKLFMSTGISLFSKNWTDNSCLVKKGEMVIFCNIFNAWYKSRSKFCCTIWKVSHYTWNHVNYSMQIKSKDYNYKWPLNC